MLCEEKFFEIYHKQPDNISFCPYRISPLGAHVDHQLGKIHGLALNKGINIAYAAKTNGIIELYSLDFPKRAQFYIPEERQNDWADYLRGATKILRKHYSIKFGISAVIQGSLPIGGLSSSAAVTIAFLLALSAVNGIQLNDTELISIAQQAENEFVGVKCGKLDQSCEVLSKQNNLLYLDCLNNTYELIPAKQDFKIAIIFSGLSRNLINSNYNLRQEECKIAAYNLLAFAGLDYQNAKLRDVPKEAFEFYKDQLPTNFKKRAIHYFSEMDRVEEGIQYWQDGNLNSYGQLIFESGKSSIENYQCGSPELITLYSIMTQIDGIYGGRFSGAGFKGCCMALIDPNKIDKIQYTITQKYLKEYPLLENKYSFHICDTANGVGQ